MRQLFIIHFTCLLIISSLFQNRAFENFPQSRFITPFSTASAQQAHDIILIRSLINKASQQLDKKPGSANLDSALFLIHKAEKLNWRVKDQNLAGCIALTTSLINQKNRKLAEGKRYAEQALRIYTNTHNYVGIGHAFEAIAANDTAGIKIRALEKARFFFYKGRKPNDEVRCLIALSVQYFDHKLYHKAIDNCDMALNICKVIKQIDLREIYDRLIYSEVMLGNWESVLKTGLISIKNHQNLNDTSSRAVYTTYTQMSIAARALDQLDNSLYFSRHAQTIALRNNRPAAIYQTNGDIASILLKKKQAPAAFALLKATRSKYAEPVDTPQDIDFNLHLLSASSHLKKIEEGHVYCAKVIRLSSFFKEQDKKFIYDSLINYYLASGQLTEAHHYKLLSDLSYRLDSIAKGESNRPYIVYGVKQSNLRVTQNGNPTILLDERNREIQKRAEVNDNRERVLSLIKIGALQQTILKQTLLVRNATIGASALLTLLLILTFYSLYNKQRTNKRLKEQQSIIQEKNVFLEKVLSEKDLLLIEKEWLVKEIHHRVKNNLQIIISLLDTQSSYLSDNDKALDVIRASQQRMHSISLIHHRLYQSENMALIDMPSYIKDLVANLSDSFNSDQKHRFTLDMVQIKLDVSQAVPIGLILNEAITNAVKHGFKHNRKGDIRISMQREENQQLVFMVIDDGPGFPKDFDIDQCTSLGMNLIKGLSSQLGGSLTISKKGKQTIITVAFRISQLESNIQPALT